MFYAYWKKVSLRMLDEYVMRSQNPHSSISLDISFTDCTKTLHDIVGKEDNSLKRNYLLEQLTKIINDPFNNFSEKEKTTIRCYLNGLEMKEISKILNRSLSSTYRIYKQAVEKIGSVLKGRNK